MKKNIFSVIIAALTVINVVLTAIMFFVMLPTFQKTNNLITQVASVLNLELESDDASADEEYTMADTEAVPVDFEDSQNLNLAMGADQKTHYAVLDGYTLTLNTKSKDYKKLSDVVKNNTTKFTDIIREVIQSHSVDDISEAVLKKEALEKIQEELDSKVVVEVSLTNFMYS